MPPRLEQGLFPISQSQEVTLGVAFVVKYFNTGKNKQCLWLGIHVPTGLAPKSMTSRPKKTASMDTPAEHWSYLFYLPGRNT